MKDTAFFRSSMLNSSSFILVGTALKSTPGGGFLRIVKVLPYFARILGNYGYRVVIFTPISGYVQAFNLLTQGGLEVEEALKIVLDDLRYLKSIENVDIDVAMKAFEQAIDVFYHTNKDPELLRPLKNFGLLHIHLIKSIEREIVRELRSYVKRSYDIKTFVYSMNVGIQHILPFYLIMKELKSSSGMLLQLPVYYDRGRLSHSSKQFEDVLLALGAAISSMQYNSFIRRKLMKLLSENLIKIIQSVSPAPLLESGDLVTTARKFGAKIRVLLPGNAVDEKIFQYRSLAEREPIAIYFGRLDPTKGIYDLLHIWKRVEKEVRRARLWIIGSFSSEYVKSRFWNLVKELNIRNIEYLGFIKSRDKLLKIVSQAKVLLYPSYKDAFPLTVLESIALGLLVVAYDIPAIKYVYRNVPPLFMVKFRDIDDMITKTTKALKLDYSIYTSLQNNPITIHFIKKFSSWKRVAITELGSLVPYL